MSVVVCRFVVVALASFVASAGIAAENKVAAKDFSAQRDRFMLVWEAAQHGPDLAWRKLAVGLEDYPLYPYLELASQQRRLSDLKPEEVEKFLTAFPDTLPAQMLRENFLYELARRQNWKIYESFYTGTERSRDLQCNALQAKLALAQPIDFDVDIKPLWLSAKALPAACDSAVQWAQSKNKITAPLIWERIDLAAQAAQSDLVSSLAPMLDGAEKTAAEHTATAIRDPQAALNDTPNWPDGAHDREAAVIALTRLARHDSDGAEAEWKTVSSHFHFDAEQRGKSLRAIAVYSASSYSPDAPTRLAAVPSDADDDTSREWRVRSALAAQDWKNALQALQIMSPTQQADARWRYLRARVLVKLGREHDAEPIFASIAQEANFHGFLAADWIDQPYAICSSQIDASAEEEKSARNNLSLQRAFEFFALDRLSDARREWEFAIAKLDPRERRLAADLATRLGWYDRAVYSLNQGDDLHFYDLRFPLARRDQIERDARAADIDPSWAYAIIRAESAWTSDAHSGADAYGLMQLLPGTAKQLAKVEKLPFSGPTTLFDPDLNIRLGTRYLSDMSLRYDGSAWLASAAYNAGVDPVGRWVNARDSLEPDFFIETIPYKETREYVARVLAFSVIYDWRMHGNAQSLASKMTRIGQPYAPPKEDAGRKSVVCPSSPSAPRELTKENPLSETKVQVSQQTHR
ncbi:MAG TPA: transglycosylase SLT domain-containing protein [Rudaea sp.]|jgi:soluble lytic murein transglycosylase|nr:transglycosylase SLT domain-containing protein [Rudaea sp.]